MSSGKLGTMREAEEYGKGTPSQAIACEPLAMLVDQFERRPERLASFGERLAFGHDVDFREDGQGDQDNERDQRRATCSHECFYK